MWNRQELKSNARIMLKANYLKINRHSPYLSITLPKYYQYYL